MKRGVFDILIVLTFIIFLSYFIQAIPLASISISEEVGCSGKCMRGEGVSFYNLSIKNIGESPFIIRDIMIRAESGWLITDIGTPKNSTFNPEDEINMGEIGGFFDYEEFPLNYRIYVYVEEKQWWGNSREVLSSDRLVLEMEPFSCTNCGFDVKSGCRYECCHDLDCEENEYCGGIYCWEIECYCGEIRKNWCWKYECCKDSHCQENYYCYKNNCVECLDNSNCDLGQYCSEEKKCIEYECMNNESCNYNEYCLENECIQLVPSYTQYIKDHQCIEYECMNNESCNYNEYCLENECNELICNFGYSKSHKCEYYLKYAIITGIIMGGLLVLLIIHNKVKRRKRKSS